MVHGGKFVPDPEIGGADNVAARQVDPADDVLDGRPHHHRGVRGRGRGNMDGDIGIAVVTANNIPLKSFKQVIRAASSELTSLMLDRRVDAVSFGVSYNHSRIREMEKGIPLNQLSVGAAAAAEVATQYGGQPCTIWWLLIAKGAIPPSW